MLPQEQIPGPHEEHPPLLFHSPHPLQMLSMLHQGQVLSAHYPHKTGGSVRCPRQGCDLSMAGPRYLSYDRRYVTARQYGPGACREDSGDRGVGDSLRRSFTAAFCLLCWRFPRQLFLHTNTFRSTVCHL